MNNNLEQLSINKNEIINFDYELAEELAQKKLSLELSNDKLAKAELKNQIKSIFGKDNEPIRRIFDLEVERQKLIIGENKVMKALENNQDIEWFNGQSANYEKSSNKFIVQDNGQEISLNFGDLISDINWHKAYKLDKNCPIEFKKQYLQILVDNKLFDLSNQQLAIEKTEINQSNNSAIDQAYQAAKENLENQIESAGLLFEKMIQGLLLKISNDLPQYQLKIDRANIEEDVEQKIDFIIDLPKKYRGVNLEETEEEKIGIQFTLKDKASVDYINKQRQVASSKKRNKDFNDLILVSVPVGNELILTKYKEWQKQGKPAGGPEKLFSTADKTSFILEILKQTDLAENQEFKKDLERYFRE